MEIAPPINVGCPGIRLIIRTAGFDADVDFNLRNGQVDHSNGVNITEE